VSQFESVLNVRYPPAFEKFARLVSKFANLDALNLTKLGCLMQTNFYHKLLLSTIAPIGVSMIIFVFTRLMMINAKDHEHKMHVIDGSVAIFLSLTYMVFASVSTTIFDTFNCKTFGDDENEYMMSDQSVDCGTSEHMLYQTYAGVMMFVYPIGIPVLYFVLLYKNREKLHTNDRDDDEGLHHIAFLWDCYEPQLWWFEIFDCVRRLSLTGLLVFVFKGQASQIVVAMVLASLSVVAFVHWRPFVKDENDNLAIVSQGAIFFTLLAGLLKKVEVDKTDKYDDNMFGTVLIFVNCIGVVMVLFGFVLKPVARVVKKLGERHVHNAELKGVTEEHDEWEKFEAYFRELAESDEFTAGWTRAADEAWRNWRTKKEAKEWLEETGAVGDSRCGSGDGPRDQFRIEFVVEHGLEDVYEYLTKFGKVIGTTLESHPMVDYGEGVLDVYLAVSLPWPLHARDLLMNRRAWLRGDEAMVLSRSIESDDAGLKRSAQQKRVRAHVALGGYWLGKVGERATRVVHVVQIDFKGVMTIDSLARRGAMVRGIGVVDEMRKLGKEEELVDEEEGRGSLFNQGRRWLRVVSTAGSVELGGDVVSKHERRKKEKKDKDTRSGPRVVPPPPPGAPPPNNNFLLRAPSRPTEGIELSKNPMHGGEVAAAVKVAKDTRHLDRAVSGGFKAKGAGLKKGGGKQLDRSRSSFQRSLNAVKEEKAEVEKKSDWITLTDEDGSGYVYYENVKTKQTQWEKPANL